MGNGQAGDLKLNAVDGCGGHGVVAVDRIVQGQRVGVNPAPRVPQHTGQRLPKRVCPSAGNQWGGKRCAPGQHGRSI